ncbi:EscU/YscU/HrcU family type III secretion system export apparatus switch protein [Halobacillus yeomjeoni]|uniref:EscU/YscU/HrcU family type III secretion system export apparatus switch protein n=1 Tax=Halobacillus yeomjeoni TaxID=311194 RepID=A0A931MU34_9BACI|nr:EscU/YscU/HrcU family type III secretion system export apparatus switch protein [Halobacillus yeomjeoni]MBH0229257.1 EscU/YscU/HrcU family type III secretion system export apparatus switch protein [Halobacillus yeomjeoni]MCA0983344.1 EscU/YscU/HrcU family type III secretion system export apparatus switch protein [Halobacillus yeomjeoni]
MNEKPSKAIALNYEADQESAPKVTAKGKGYIADNILKKAEENNIPIQKDASMVELLSQLNINEQIPEELYHVVAEVFAFIYQTDQQAKNSNSMKK